jgi:hypothetical protein
MSSQDLALEDLPEISMEYSLNREFQSSLYYQFMLISCGCHSKQSQVNGLSLFYRLKV